MNKIDLNNKYCCKDGRNRIESELFHCDKHPSRPYACVIKTQYGYHEWVQFDQFGLSYCDDYNLVPQYNLTIDDKILASDDGEIWFNRHFSHYENGELNTFQNGETSWSTENGKTETWKHWIPAAGLQQ